MFGRRRRKRRPERIDPFGVGEPWRKLVQGALQAQARYRRAVDGVAAGPLRARLHDIGRRINEGCQECWRLAQRGNALQEAVSALDVAATRGRLAAAGGEGGTSADDAVVASLQAQLATAERMEATVGQARDQLARLEAGLGQAAAIAVELIARRADATDAAVLGSDVNHLVDDVAALRSALDEVSAPGA